MTYPYDRRRRNSGGVVPYETAKKIARQRDQLAEEVEKLRQQKRQATEAMSAAERERDALEQKLGETREEVRRLERRLEEAEERAGAARQEESAADGERVERLERRVASLTDDLERLRTRSEQTDTQARRDERLRLLSNLGDVLHSVERGIAMQPEGAEKEGLRAIQSQLFDYLRREGATLTGEAGAKMDPKLHEAIEVVDAPDFESGEIVDVSRPGVLLDDGTVVLPAKVQVAA